MGQSLKLFSRFQTGRPIYTILLLIFIFLYHQANTQKNEIYTISSYQEALPLVNIIDESTLILFDVDDTLITSPALNSNYFSWWFKLLTILKNPRLLTTNWEIVYSTIWQQAPFTLIEPEIPDGIKNLQEKGATVLALTSMESGQYGVIPNMPKWRYNMLKNMNITFSTTYANTIFTNFPEHRKGHPVLYNGILCANQRDKGKVLAAFLRYANIKPSKIIFFDDQISALNSIGDVCREYGISYKLINYTGAQKLKKTWNLSASLQQFQYLIAENRWIDNQSLAHY